MKIIAALIVFAVLALIFIVATKKKAGIQSTEGEWPFYAKKLMSAPEQTLYFRLVLALPDYIVLSQVQLSSFLGVKKGNQRLAWLNRINRMSADFVVCAKDTSVIAVVELDDSSHERSDRKIADAKKDKALIAAGVRIVRWHVKSIPDKQTIRAELHAQPMVEVNAGMEIEPANQSAQ